VDPHSVFALDPVLFARDALGLPLDDLQAAILNPILDYGIVNCCRQFGKTTALALKATHTALYHPGSVTLYITPTRRQTAEPLRRIAAFLRQLNIPTRSDGLCRPSLVLPNGSRILGLPSTPDTLRGYSPNLVIVDEAAYCSPELEAVLRPMMMNNTEPRSFWLASTPNGRQGMFYDTYTQTTDPRWHKFTRTAYECPRIKQEFLAMERERLGADRFAQEYLCEFHENQRALFPSRTITAAFDPTLPPLLTDRRWWLGADTPARCYLGLDLGRDHDHAALAVLEYLPRPTGRRDPVTLQPLRELQVRTRHLHQFPTGTNYVEIVRQVMDLLNHSVFAYGVTLVIDSTGVGAAVTDLLRHALRQQSSVKVELVPVTITAAHQVTRTPQGFHVPKYELMEGLRHLLDHGLLRIASQTPGAETLRQELEGMQRQTRPSGLDAFTGKHQGGTDDLVLALSLAAWKLLYHHHRTVNQIIYPRAA